VHHTGSRQGPDVVIVLAIGTVPRHAQGILGGALGLGLGHLAGGSLGTKTLHDGVRRLHAGDQLALQTFGDLTARLQNRQGGDDGDADDGKEHQRDDLLAKTQVVQHGLFG